MKKNTSAIFAKIFFLLVTTVSMETNAGNLQSLKIITNAADAVVFVGIYQVGKGEIVETTIDKTAQSHQIKVAREGYKTEYLTIMAYRDHRTFTYPSEVVVECKTPFIKRAIDQKYAHLFKTEFNVKKEDFFIRNVTYDYYRDSVKYSERKLKVDKRNEKSGLQERQDLNIENSIFTTKINKILANLDFIDTISKVFKDYSNTLYVKANVKSLECNNITYYSNIYSPTIFIEVEAKIGWEILDYYEQSKFSVEFESKSGGISVSTYSKPSECIDFAIEDMFTSSFLQLLQIKDVQELMKKENIISNLTPFDITSPKKLIQNIEEAKAATVTIKRSDGGHGSGCIISNDGYIITNYHVISGKKELLVLQENSNQKLKAEIVRINPTADIALLKVDTIFDFAFQITADKNFTIGDDVFAIGTPKSIELGQSISKGIISSLRKTKMGEVIQTDASVNSGNSGGPLVNDKGNLVGIVNAKILDVGVEGLGFSIPAYKIMEYLSLKYK